MSRHVDVHAISPVVLARGRVALAHVLTCKDALRGKRGPELRRALATFHAATAELNAFGDTVYRALTDRSALEEAMRAAAGYGHLNGPGAERLERWARSRATENPGSP